LAKGVCASAYNINASAPAKRINFLMCYRNLFEKLSPGGEGYFMICMNGKISVLKEFVKIRGVD
jgi:hypothetical protein